MHSENVDDERIPEDIEMAVDALDASCIVRPSAQDTAAAKNSVKGECI